MEESTALTIYQPIFDQEALERFKEALAQIVDVFNRMAEALAQAVKPMIEAATEWIRNLYEEMLHSVATPKEWHLMHHAKKRRTRKKYRNRLTRRLAAMLAEGGEDDG